VAFSILAAFAATPAAVAYLCSDGIIRYIRSRGDKGPFPQL
jgi:hypothetical protein